jgi:hypothetical protein
MTDEDVVARVASMWGRKPQRLVPRQERWSVSFFVRITGAKAVSWMTALQPMMGERRCGQINRAIASYAPRPRALLDHAKAAEALRLLNEGATVRSVADHFGVSIWCIYDLRLGRTHRDVPRPKPLDPG